MSVDPNVSTRLSPADIEKNRGFVMANIQQLGPDPATTSAKLPIFVLGGTLDASGVFVPGFSGGGSGAAAQQVQGNVATATTDAGNPVKIGFVYTAVPPTLTDGQRTNALSDSRGNLGVLAKFGNATGSDGISNTAILSAVPVSSVNAPGSANPLLTGNYVFNGTSWDRQRKANVFSRVASSVAAGNPAVTKAVAGDVRQFWGQNAAAITYLQLYNKATAPVLGTDVPTLTFPIPASTVFSQAIQEGGAYFPAGVAFAFTTDAAGTTGAAAAAITAFALLVA